MTSLFEFEGVNGTNPAELLVDLRNPREGGATLLEFFVLEDEVRARITREDEKAKAHQPKPSADLERVAQTKVMIDAARADAKEQARQEWEEELATRMDAERIRIEQVCSEFSMDRQRYFSAAESQVVKLAIAVARRILSREVEADVMHLTATVRAALARIHDGSASTLRVCAGEQSLWKALFADNSDGSVTVVGDAHLEAGECVLVTEVGTVELGVQVQLAEIERGFGELLRRQGD